MLTTHNGGFMKKIPMPTKKMETKPKKAKSADNMKNVKVVMKPKAKY